MNDETETAGRLLDVLLQRPQPTCPACGDRFVVAAVSTPETKCIGGPE